jgi:predicted PurR-regulated permease PerM
MEIKVKDHPFYLQSTVVLFGVILLVYSLSQLADILIPLAFSGFLAILLNPLVLRFQTLRLPQWLSILLAMLMALIIISGLFYFLSSQIIQFGDSLPLLKKKLAEILIEAKHWVNARFGIAESKQSQMIHQAVDHSQYLFGRTLNGMLSVFTLVFLIPVYVFFMLLYKTLIINFIYEVFAEENSKKVGEVLSESKSAIQSYIVGLLIETLIVGILNSLALLLLGVDYAILLGCLGAILNLIPYLGGLVAIALPVLIATVTKDGYSTQLGVIGAYIVIQFIDNNILVPRIVSSKVQINALMSIIIVLLGNQLWGLSGMFLSIPFLAVLKIIFDRIDDLKPWGKLLGDNVPSKHKGELWQKRWRKSVLLKKDH